jgi:hypothetical protein
LKLKEEDMTQNEQSIKLKLMKHIDAFIEEVASEDEGGEWSEFGAFPDNLTEMMGEAAMTVMLTVKGTNKYRDENPE